jgi:hypothetical protein
MNLGDNAGSLPGGLAAENSYLEDGEKKALGVTA